MPRSRSRSPKRERRKSRSRSRDRERDRDRDRERHRRHKRSRSRSRDKGRRRSRDRRHDRDERRHERVKDRDPRPQNDDSSDEEELIFHPVEKNPVTEEDIQSMPEDEQELMRVMGFSGFDTTKDKQVVGNEHYSANICKKRRYRQYMNRKGGFNRPLDFIA